MCAYVQLTVYGLIHPLQSCKGSVHIQSEAIKLFLAQMTVMGLLFQHLTAEDLNTSHSKDLKNTCSYTGRQTAQQASTANRLEVG